MPLRVWRGRRTIFAECTSCGSYGSCAHLELSTRMTPEIAAAVEQHTARMLALREHYKTATGSLAMKFSNKEILQQEFTRKMGELAQNHFSQITAATALLPDPEGKVVEIAGNCPWCHLAEEVEVELLPDDVVEPSFSLAELVAQAQKKGE